MRRGEQRELVSSKKEPNGRRGRVDEFRPAYLAQRLISTQVLEGEYSMAGPMCAQVAGGYTCYASDTRRACETLGGENIGDRFCVLDCAKIKALRPLLFEKG